MEKYEIVDTVTKQRYEFLGISKDQAYSFEYKVKEGFNQTVHMSHINVDCLLVYDKKYILTNSDVEYFYKDLGGVL